MSDQDQKHIEEGSAVTLRAVMLGSVCSFCIAAGASYGTHYLQGSFMALGTSMPGAIFLMFVLTLLINPLLKLIHPRAGLRRRELLVVYIMMVMASPIPTLFAGRYLAQMMAPFYYATQVNEWRTLIQPHIPHWMMPYDPQVSKLFYEGAASGQPIPWEAWLPYFFAWSPLIWALFLVMITIMVILRKQWVEHERLIYPLIQVPLAMSQEGEKGERLGGFFKNPVMWAGFSLPALWGTLHGLYNYFPETIPIAKEVDVLLTEISVFQSIPDLYITFRWNIIGFFYFLKTEIAFSLWFFNLLAYATRGVFGILGISSTEALGAGHDVWNPILAHICMGAILVLFLGGFWSARQHLRQVFRKAFIGDKAVDDSDEILSYRASVFILLVSSLVLIGWLWLAGMPLWMALAILFLAAALLVAYARVVAEGGLSDGAPPVVPAGILLAAVDTSALSASGLVVLGTTYFWTTGRSFVITSCANSLRLVEELGGNRRQMFWVILLALIVAMAGSVWMVMTLSHTYGGLNMWIILSEGDRGGISMVERVMRSPTGVHWWSWINTGIGVLLMSGLMVARWLFTWWPLHPLGLAIGPIWIMDHLWFNMFLAWLIKIIVLKYGGVSLYMRTRPFFMGMILGFFTPGGFFLIADYFTGMSSNVIFWG